MRFPEIFSIVWFFIMETELSSLFGINDDLRCNNRRIKEEYLGRRGNTKRLFQTFLSMADKNGLDAARKALEDVD